MNNRQKTISVVGIISIIATVIVFNLIFPLTHEKGIISYYSILLSELLFFGLCYLVEELAKKTEQSLFRPAWYFIVSAYAISSTALSVIEFFLQIISKKIFLSIQIIFIAVTSICLIIVYNSYKSVSSTNRKTLSKLDTFYNKVELLYILSNRFNDLENTNRAKDLAEELRFTDSTASVDADNLILQLILSLDTESKLEIQDNNKINTLLQKLENAINERQIELKTVRRGKI